MEKKVCNKCKQEKELKEFYKDKGCKDGYKNICKECNNKKYTGICKLCGEEFFSSKKNQIYCSIKCLTESQKKRINFNCDYCGVEVEVPECFYKNKNNHYCSDACRNKGHSHEIKGENNPRYNSIMVKCDYCACDILRRESKIDGNNFCNIRCYSEYRKTHYSKENHSNWNGGDVISKCSCCNKEIRKRKSQIRDNNYCSIECMGKDRCRLYKGENNSNWNGGVTNISEYLRHCLNKWKDDTMKFNKYKCDISESNKNLIIHHLYNFSDILLETFEILGIPIYEQIKDYSEIELKLLEDKCLELHYKYGLGVCLTEELHKEFHKIYGKKNNTLEQYLEFKENKIKEEDLESIV